MITTTGNNFGASSIQIQDFQAQDYIILNAKFDVDTTTDEYQQSSDLELYVPNLSISKSSVTSCFFRSEKLLWEGESYEEVVTVGTTLKTWIKDSNTICFEKLGIYDSLGKITILICTMYAKRGVRGSLLPGEHSNIIFNYETTTMRQGYSCYIAPEWCFFTFYYSDVYDGWGEPIKAQLEGFPTDISVDIFLIGGGQQTGCPGVYVAEGRIENGVLDIPHTSTTQRNTGSDPFVYLFAVRNKQ